MSAMQELCDQVWEARRKRELKRDPKDLGRALVIAMASTVRDVEDYDPEGDVRVSWLRSIIKDMRSAPKWREPRGSVDEEYNMLFLLGKLQDASEGGKFAAAGERRSA